MMAAVLMQAAHLTRRFFSSLGPSPLSREDTAWAAEHLLASEQVLWALMSDSDRRHAISVARRVLYQVPVIRTYGPSHAVRWT